MGKENKEKVSVRLEPLHIAFVQADAAIQKRSFAAMLDLVIGEYYGRRSGSEPQYGFVRGLMEAQFAHEHPPIRSWEGAAPAEPASTIPASPPTPEEEMVMLTAKLKPIMAECAETQIQTKKKKQLGFGLEWD